MPRRVFITVAEVSGDQHAAHLIQSLRQLDGGVVVEGLGGARMRAAGALIHHETIEKAAMGVHGVSLAAEVWRLLRRAREHFDRSPPDLQICVDSPAMNFHFARIAHERGIPVLYYIAPQVWAWREGRIRKVRRWVDHVACILPFEEAYFRSHGVNATFVGHPLFDELTPNPAAPAPLKGRPPVVGLLPGSRRSETTANFPHLLDVAGRIRHAFPGVRFLIPTTAATAPIVARLVAGQGDIEHGEGLFDQMVPRCDLCLTVSGTATLHVATHGVPMIVVYRINPLLWHAGGRWLIKTRTFALVNLLANQPQHIVPEFVPWFGSNDRVADCALDLLRNPEKLAAQRQRLLSLIQMLNRPGASLNAAKIAMQMMQRRPDRAAAPALGAPMA